EVPSVGGDAVAREHEETRAAKLHAPSGAARHRVGDDVAECPLRGGAARVLDDSLHAPDVVSPLAKHATGAFIWADSCRASVDESGRISPTRFLHGSRTT